MTDDSDCRLENGFSLVEALLATALLAVAVAALAEVVALCVRSNGVAGNGTRAAVLASRKAEMLRSQSLDSLTLSPGNTLQADTDGYVEYLDAEGSALDGGAATPQAAAAYVRRWRIEPLPSSVNGAVVIQVLVTRRREPRGAHEGPLARQPEDARVIVVKARKSP